MAVAGRRNGGWAWAKGSWEAAPTTQTLSRQQGGWAEDPWAKNSWEAQPTTQGASQQQGAESSWSQTLSPQQGGGSGVDADGPGCRDGVPWARAEAPSLAMNSMAMETSDRSAGTIAGRAWTAEDMIGALGDYYESLPPDTFCGQATDSDDLPWQWKPQDNQRSARLPSSCVMRQELVELPQHCEPTVVANILAKELHKIGEVIEVGGKLMPAPSLQRKQPPGLGKLPPVSKRDDSFQKDWGLGGRVRERPRSLQQWGRCRGLRVR